MVSLLSSRSAFFTASRSFSEGWNVTTLRAEISMRSPVCGLRPGRLCLLFTVHLPKPEILTSSPCSSLFFHCLKHQLNELFRLLRRKLRSLADGLNKAVFGECHGKLSSLRVKQAGQLGFIISYPYRPPQRLPCQNSQSCRDSRNFTGFGEIQTCRAHGLQLNSECRRSTL